MFKIALIMLGVVCALYSSARALMTHLTPINKLENRIDVISIKNRIECKDDLDDVFSIMDSSKDKDLLEYFGDFNGVYSAKQIFNWNCIDEFMYYFSSIGVSLLLLPLSFIFDLFGPNALEYVIDRIIGDDNNYDKDALLNSFDCKLQSFLKEDKFNMRNLFLLQSLSFIVFSIICGFLPL